MLDLRLLGLMRTAPVATLSRVLTPISLIGLALMLVSGTVLFAADARAMAASDLFLIKLGLIGLALLNAVGFRLAFGDGHRPVPPAGRLMALASLILWFSVVVAGRWIAYG